MWMTSVWTPTSSRSLGFAIGPFKEVFDPGYYNTENNKHENVDKEDDI